MNFNIGDKVRVANTDGCIADKAKLIGLKSEVITIYKFKNGNGYVLKDDKEGWVWEDYNLRKIEEEKMKKEYHFFEVMKAYSEDVCFNNKNKFKRVSDGLIVSVNNNNELNYSSDFAKINVWTDKFTLVEEPKEVSFMQAIKAIGNGVKIKCVRDSMISYYENSTLIDTDGCAIWSDEIIEGKWYIINE
jgi:hypothetical protein